MSSPHRIGTCLTITLSSITFTHGCHRLSQIIHQTKSGYISTGQTWVLPNWMMMIYIYIHHITWHHLTIILLQNIQGPEFDKSFHLDSFWQDKIGTTNPGPRAWRIIKLFSPLAASKSCWSPVAEKMVSRSSMLRNDRKDVRSVRTVEPVKTLRKIPGFPTEADQNQVGDLTRSNHLHPRHVTWNPTLGSICL